MRKALLITCLAILAFAFHAKANVYVTNYSNLQYLLKFSDGSSPGIPASSGPPTFSLSPSVLGPMWAITELTYAMLTVTYAAPSASNITPPFTFSASSDATGTNVYLTIF